MGFQPSVHAAFLELSDRQGPVISAEVLEKSRRQIATSTAHQTGFHAPFAEWQLLRADPRNDPVLICRQCYAKPCGLRRCSFVASIPIIRSKS